MIAYVDSNVFLEAVLHQAREQDAVALLDAAAVGRFELRVPVFVLFEIEQKLQRLSAVRQDLAVMFSRHAETMGIANREMAAEGKLAANALRDRFLSEDGALKLAKSELLEPALAIAAILPLTGAMLQRALRLAGEEASLHFADAIVVACVLEDASALGTPSILVTRDTGISEDLDAVRVLRAAGCTVISDLHGGLDYLLTHS